jgi:thiamine-phosphate diphosphorylase
VTEDGRTAEREGGAAVKEEGRAAGRDRGAARAVPRLHVVTTLDVLRRPGFTADARRILDLGGAALHLRARGDVGRLLLELATSLRAHPGADGRLLVNDRVDVARIAGAGAHLPEAGLTPFRARTILGRSLLLGRSVHGHEAAAEGLPHLDYLLFGHVFATPSKPGLPPAGPEGLVRVVAAAGGLPVIAIGGVTPGRVGALVEAGAHGVAAISGIWDAREPSSAAARYLTALDAAGADPAAPGRAAVGEDGSSGDRG